MTNEQLAILLVGWHNALESEVDKIEKQLLTMEDAGELFGAVNESVFTGMTSIDQLRPECWKEVLVGLSIFDGVHETLDMLKECIKLLAEKDK